MKNIVEKETNCLKSGKNTYMENWKSNTESKVLWKKETNCLKSGKNTNMENWKSNTESKVLWKKESYIMRAISRLTLSLI